jgi:UDP-N-acetylglucosamine 1-carboxyvinyltransferase
MITRPEVEEGLGNELLLLDQMGVKLKFIGNQIKIVRPLKLKAININVTSIGIYSDHQPFFALMLTKADKPSLITEKVWKSRFSYAEQLAKLGMKLEVNGNCLKITPSQPNATTTLLIAQDLRAAAVLVIAALKLETPVRIEGIDHLERGYDDFMEDLKRIGVDVQLN